MIDESGDTGASVSFEQKASDHRSKNSQFHNRNKTFRKIYRGVSRVFKREKTPVESCCKFDPEVLCNQKREWMDLRSIQDKGLEWPEHCFEHLVIVGLPHTMDIQEVRKSILKEKVLRKNGSDCSTSSAQSEKLNHTPPRPSYCPELLYQFPEDKPLHMKAEQLVSFCFPHGVTPQLLKRTHSMGALNEVVYGQQHLVHSDQSFVFVQKGGDDISMFGICYLVNQLLHTPPGLVKHKYKDNAGSDGDNGGQQQRDRHHHHLSSMSSGHSKHLVAAPRCYCLLSRYPFFKLHFQFLNSLLGLERLESISDYMNEILRMPPPDSSLLLASYGSRKQRKENRGAGEEGRNTATNRFYSTTPDPCAIRAFSASPTLPKGTYLEHHHLEFKESQDQESLNGRQSPLIVSDAETHTPKFLVNARDSFSSIPGNTTNSQGGNALHHSFTNGTALSSTRLLKHHLTTTPISSFQDPAQLPPATTTGIGSCSCSLPSDEMPSPCTSCSITNRAESEKNILIPVVKASGNSQRSSFCQGSPIPPRYPDPEHQKAAKHGQQELSHGSLPSSSSQQMNNARSWISENPQDPSIGHTAGGGYELSDQDSKSAYGSYCCHSRSVSGYSLRDGYCENLESSQCSLPSNVLLYATNGGGRHAINGVIGDSAYYPSSYEYPYYPLPRRLCSTSPPSTHHNSTFSGDSEIFLTSSSMPDLSLSSCHQDKSGGRGFGGNGLNSWSSFVRCPSVGDICRFPSNKAIKSWSEDDTLYTSSNITTTTSIIPPCQKLLWHFRDMKVPAPGEKIIFVPEEEGLQSIEFTRLKFQGHEKDSNNNRLESCSSPSSSLQLKLDLAQLEMETTVGLRAWTVAVLCRSLSLDNILTLLVSALLEKQIVFFCSNIGVLSSSVLSLLPLIQPFSWHALLLSTLPCEYLEFLEAPIPFALGIQHKTPEIAQMCKDVIRVNIYKDKIKNAPLATVLPGYKSLHSKLSQWHKEVQDCPKYSGRPMHVVTPKECRAVEKFMSVLRGHLTSLVSDIRRHTITDVTSKTGVTLLMEESFIQSFPAKDQGFMKEFSQTTMFSTYVDSITGAL